MKALVIGCGSIGRRHISNLLKLGVEVYAYDKDLPLLERTLKEFNIKTSDFRSEHIRMDAWVLAMPPNYHYSFMKECLEHGYHCFVEKPISDKLEGLEKLVDDYEKAKLTLMVGYQLRLNERIRELRDIVKSNEYGKLLSVQANYGYYLPYWHKYEDYHKLYTGHKNEGGGACLDASHEIDYVSWIVGSPVNDLKSMASKISNLDIDVEDTVDIILKFENDIQANIHLDIINKQYTRKCDFIFEDKTLHWEWRDENEYYYEMYKFVECIETGKKPPCDGKSAIETLILCLKILNR